MVVSLLVLMAELGAGKVGHKIDGISFVPALFGLSGEKRKVRFFAFSESRSGKAWVRIQRYKLYNDGQLHDVQKDAFGKKPIKNVTGPLIKQREALQSSFTRIKYPNI